MIAYKYFKIDFSRAGSGAPANANQYVTLNELQFRETLSGANFLVGSTLTLNGSTYSGQNPINCIDGNESTFVEFVTVPQGYLTTSNRLWLRFELATPKILREFRVLSTSYPNEKPQDFKISGSNDGTTWELLYEQDDYMSGSISDRTTTMNSSIGGTVKTINGSEVTVIVLKPLNNILTESGRILTVNGEWKLYVESGYNYYVLYTGVGLRPEADGEITPTVF